MLNHASSSVSEENLSSLTDELLDTLLEVDQTYPWNPTHPETEAYFNQLEAEFPLMDAFDESEITAQADTFFSQLNQSWESVDDPHHAQSLWEKFGQTLPRSWFETMVNQAEQLAKANTSQLHQLVECVKPLWQNWTDEDLQVFARPLAHAMRGKTQVKQEAWQNLSEIERIRFTMMIAKALLDEFTPNNG